MSTAQHPLDKPHAIGTIALLARRDDGKTVVIMKVTRSLPGAPDVAALPAYSLDGNHLNPAPDNSRELVSLDRKHRFSEIRWR